jgi:thymidylate synthase|tara:strand:- start:1192 stop:2019 length:828 start_codon:yes stop_codon:yes gene_type:complete
MKEINIRYKKMLWDVYRQPDFICKPRGLTIKEKINHSFKVGMEDPVITLPERKLSYSFMFGEAAWMLRGKNDVYSVRKYVDGVKRFSDDGVTFYGAYGPKILTQWSYVVETLRNDNDSRQAVINIWRENPRSSKDIPCTLSLQFMLREAHDITWLHTIASMRSNDAWLGTPYDTFNFSAISFYIVCWLNFHGIKCKLGELNIQAGSRHIYHNDFRHLDSIFTSVYMDETELNLNDLIPKYKNDPDLFIKNLEEAADFTPTKDKGTLNRIDYLRYG